MSEPIRVLQVVTYMGRGGLETMLMNYYRNIDRNKVQFDFLTHRDERWDYDDEIESLGGKIYHLPKLNPFSKNYLNALDKFFKEHKEYHNLYILYLSDKYCQNVCHSRYFQYNLCLYIVFLHVFSSLLGLFLRFH